MDFLPVWPLATNTLFFFGVLLFCGALGGYFAHRWSWLPSITGFMVVGLVAGPHGLGLISLEGIAQTRVVIDVALALILYRLGLSLDLKTLARDRSLLLIAAAESLATFAAVYAALGWFGVDRLAAAVIATIAISSSPAVLIHVTHELGARGPVSERAKALVALNNVIAYVAFSAVLPALYSRVDAPLAVTLGAPAFRLLGSAALGLAAGWGLHFAARKTKAAPQYQLALVIGAVMVTLGGAQILQLSPLFAPLILGAVVRSLERDRLVADLQFGPSFELFFIVLFVYAGANLHVKEIIAFAPAALAFVFARTLAKLAGIMVTGRAQGIPLRQGATTALLLVPMAGLAIGLVNTTATLFPEKGAIVSAVVFAAVALLETVGPLIATQALRWSGDELDPAAEG